MEKIENFNFSDFEKITLDYPFLISIIKSLIVLLVGFIITKYIVKIISKMLNKANTDPILITFVESIIIIVLRVLVIVIAITQLGFNMTSILAVMATVGVGVGLGLQESFENIASGALILISKPFQTNDFIELENNISGTVKEIHLFFTLLLSLENKKVIVPNKYLMSNLINNCSIEQNRRIQILIPISYKADTRQVKQIINDVISKNQMLLTNPEPKVNILSFKDTHIEFVVWAWVDSQNFLPTLLSLNEAIINNLRQANIIMIETIPTSNSKNK